MRSTESEADPTASFRRFGLIRLGCDHRIVGVVYKCTLHTMEDLGLVCGVVLAPAMPVKMIVGDIGDRGAVEFQRIGEMQLEGTQLNA